MKKTTSLMLASLLLFGCQQGAIRQREKGALAGGALGAGLGAIVGNQVGNSGAGIAIGSAIGAISGGLVGNAMDSQDDQSLAVQQNLDARDREIAENRRLLDELRRSGADYRETDRGIVINIPDVLFEFDSARLTRDADYRLDKITQAIEHSDRRISVEGHTDSVGTDSYNRRLSEDRARAVADGLQRRGISPRRMVTFGYGESRPIASNATDTGRKKNRRVEIVLEKSR